MARAKIASNLLGMVDSDSEDDLGGVAKGRPATHAATNPPARDSIPAPKRGRPPAAASKNKVAKPAQQTAAARRAADKRSAAAAAAAAAAIAAAEATDAAKAGAEAEAESETEAAATVGPNRRALADKTNEQANEPTEAAGATKKRGRGRPKAAPKVVEVEAQETEEADTADMAEASDEAAQPTMRRPGRGTAATAPAEDAVDEENEDGGGDDEDAPAIPKTRPAEAMEMDSDTRSGTQAAAAQKKLGSDSSRSGSSYSGLQSPFRPSQRPTSRPSLSSDGGDVAIRRRLGDLTKKYDALEARYRDLKEIGIKEAERNFDRLKKQSETRAKSADELIASLRDELAHYRSLAKEGDRTKRALEASEARATDLGAQVGQLKAELRDSQAEAKTLATKLSAARSATADSAAAALPLGVVPSSAIKKKTALMVGHAHGSHGSHGSHGALPAAVVEAMQASSQTAQLKEDLYGDLTGLLVRSAKRETTTEPGAGAGAGSGGSSRVRELYDCIQTGRNGSLHFKLCLDTGAGAGAGSDAADKAGAAGTPEDARFVYTPQIDPNRDAALIERLPDYLVEEISFPRAQAAKFYKRVMQSLMEERYSY